MDLEFDFSDVKPSVFNALLISLIVILTIPLWKWAMDRWPVPGLSQLVKAV